MLGCFQGTWCLAGVQGFPGRFPSRCQHWFLGSQWLLEIFLSLDASVVDPMLLQKLAHSLRFDVLVSFCIGLSSYGIHMYVIHRSAYY